MKKIILAGVTTLLFVGAIAFAYNNNSKDISTCPNRPGCICKKESTVKATTTPTTKEICPNRPGCIYKK